MKRLILVFLILTTLLLAGCTREEVNNMANTFKTNANEVTSYAKSFVENDETRREAKFDVAEEIANFVILNNMNEIKLEEAEASYEGYKELIDNLNLGIDIINKHTDFDFNYLSKEREAYKEFLKKVSKYTPLIEEYNGLILASREFDRANELTANEVIMQTMKMSTESFLIFSPTVHMTTFKSVGTMASSFGLTNLAKVCGPCVSSIMSTSYWGGKNFLVDQGGDTMEIFFENGR